MLRVLCALWVVSVCGGLASAAVVTSTPNGGPWAEWSTWQGGFVPRPGDDVAIAGSVQVFSDTECRNLLVFPGGVLTSAGLSPRTLTVAHSVNNKGIIQNGINFFYLHVGGHLSNAGSWANRQTILTGTADRHLGTTPGTTFASPLQLAADAAGDVMITAPFHMKGNLDVTGGRLIMGPDSPFTLDEGFFSGDMLCNGNELRFKSGSYLQQCTVDAAVLIGEVEVSALVDFTGGLTVKGTLQNREYTVSEITVKGPLVNEGTIRDNLQPLSIIALDDVQNLGTWFNSKVVLAGAQDQTVGTGHSIRVPGFVLDSRITGDSYRWYKDGILLPFEIDATLTFVHLDDDQHGTYHCEGTGGVRSRKFVVAEDTGLTPAPLPRAVAHLEQNFPNPFNPSTEFAFTVAAAGPVRLALYDLAGRQVALLVDGPRNAGRHVAQWQPEGLASGIFFYRLTAGGQELVRKAILLK